MKTLYIECNMGVAGDMLMAALMALCPNPDEFIKKMNALGLKDTIVRAVKTEKHGISGYGIDVVIDGMMEDCGRVFEERPCRGECGNDREHDHADADAHDHAHQRHVYEYVNTREHSHAAADDIVLLIHALNLPEKVKEKACAVYAVLAEAEAFVHGQPVSHIHFHEVGTRDAICDIVGCCLALELISPENIIVSPIHVGSGSVKCQHGVLPVPAPATAYILRETPIYGGEIKGELCTPTGAALVKTFAHSFGAMPVMKVWQTGYGMGKKDFGQLNCVRVFLGESSGQNGDVQSGDVYEISCNLDDITAEELAFSFDVLFEAGALDVFATPIVMKKGRAAHILTVLADGRQKDDIAKMMLRHTTTRGVRMSPCERLTLDSRQEKVETEYGVIGIKVSEGYGITKAKPEYDCIAAATKKHGVTFAEVSASALRAFYRGVK